MPKRPMTPHDLWTIPRVGVPEPLPDGSAVVVPVTTYGIEANHGITRLWLVSAEGKPRRPLTAADVSSTQPAVSPDGSRVAFVREPGGDAGRPVFSHNDKPQLYVMPLDGGEAERLTDLPLGVANPKWFPDGQRIGCLVPLFRDVPSAKATERRAKQLEDDPVKAHATEDRVYRYWDRWLTDGRIHHIFAVEADGGQAIDLTPAWRRWLPPMDPAGSWDIAPDGSQIAFTACRSNPPHDPLLWAVYVAATPWGSSGPRPRARLLNPRHKAHAFRPVYSTDARRVLYGTQHEIDFYADRVRLVEYDGRAHRVLNQDWDRSPSWWAFDEQGRICVAAEEAARLALFSLGDGSAEAHPTELARGGWWGGASPANGRVFANVGSLDQPPEVAVWEPGQTAFRRMSDFTDAHTRQLRLAPVEEMTFTGAEGRTVQMFVLYPPDRRAGPPRRRGRLPLVHLVHGGPHGVFGDDWHWRWNAQVFAAAGYLVAMVNFHGSTGWGQEFAASILGRWGDQPYHDLMAATDHLINAGLADPKRMALAGGSYGGYLVTWMATQTDRFKCVVNHAGVADLQSQYASDVTQGRRRSMGGEPWDNVEGMDRYNPMRQARGFKSPMLITHGQLDYRVPYTQGLELYNVYKARRLPARLVCYPDENHWILTPRNSLHWYGEVLAWLERWLGS
jgi:dipeptidyl aminopeptidase/acylaminoacyl peptidase